MGDLFSSLTTASRALDAMRYGLDVVEQHIANASTPGFSRGEIDLAPIAPDAPGEPGRGVEVVGIRAMRDKLLDRRLQEELGSEREQAAIADALGVVETALGQSGSSLDAKLQSFFDSFANLADDATSAVARRGVQLQGTSLASAFNDIASRLETARRGADHQIVSAADDINSLTSRIASLNHSMGAAGSREGSMHVQDEQSQLIRSLSELIDISALPRANGGFDISIGNGQALVVGDASYAVSTSPTPPNGMATLTLQGSDVTALIGGGTLGGLLQVRDVNIPDYQNRLDTLADGVVQQVNTLHSSGYDLSGNAGGDFFSYSSAPTGVQGAAAAMQLDSGIAGDPRLIAAGALADPGDNQNARALADLRDARVLDSNTSTFNDTWSQLVYRVGRDTRDATDQQKSRAQIVAQVNALRDEVSGVSLDEEAMHLLKFQRAYEANARFFRTIDTALDTLLHMV